jgi:hypothetical protein
MLFKMVYSAANFQNELGYALAKNSDRLIFEKASVASQVAGGFCSLWRATGFPVQPAIPGGAALCNNTTAGSMAYTNPIVGQEGILGWGYYVSGTAGQALEIHDRLAHMGGLSGILTTAQNVLINLQTLAVPADRLGDATYNDVMWWIEWYTATGTTGVNATCAVTYDDNSTGNIVVAVPASTGAARALPILTAVAGRAIKALNTIQLSATTGTAGSFGVTATRQRTILENDVAFKGKDHSWAMLGAPEIPANSCLFGVMPCVTTSTGIARGQIKLAKA